jgi:hypothetical protein
MATEYYVANAPTGSDSNSGLVGFPWETIAKVMSYGSSPGFSPGDNIYFNRGDTWREQATVLFSGDSGGQITFGAYGSGDLPQIFGSAAPTSWADQGSNVWRATCGSDPVGVFFVETDDSVTWGTEDGSPESEYDWYWSSPYLYCYAITDPDTRYNSVEATQREDCFWIQEKSYITVENLELAYADKYGVRTYDAAHIIVDGCLIHHFAPKNGGQCDGVMFERADYCTAKNNTINNCGNHGVFNFTGNGGSSIGNIIEDNEIWDCYHTLIDVQCPNGTHSGPIIRRNLLYFTSDYGAGYAGNGIYSQGSSSSNKVTNMEISFNLLYNCDQNGVQIGQYTTTVSIYNNMVCRHRSGSIYTTNAFFIWGPGISGVTLKNNIGIDVNGRCLIVQNSSMITACDYNLWYNSVGAVYVTVANLSPDDFFAGDFADYKTDTGWDTNGLWEDAQFVNKAGNDFRIQGGSPCKDAGVDVGLSLDYFGNMVWSGTAPDVGVHEKQQGDIPTALIRDILLIRDVFVIR